MVRLALARDHDFGWDCIVFHLYDERTERYGTNFPIQRLMTSDTVRI
jgi:hypothetical protein